MNKEEIEKVLSHSNDKVIKIVNEAKAMSNIDIDWVLGDSDIWKKYVLFLMALQPELFKSLSTQLHADSQKSEKGTPKKRLWEKWTDTANLNIVMKIADVNDTNVTDQYVKLTDDKKQ